MVELRIYHVGEPEIGGKQNDVVHLRAFEVVMVEDGARQLGPGQVPAGHVQVRQVMHAQLRLFAITLVVDEFLVLVEDLVELLLRELFPLVLMVEFAL